MLLFEFIHAKAEAPPTGFEDLGIVAIFLDTEVELEPFCSSILPLLGSHLSGIFSTWLFRRSPETRGGPALADGREDKLRLDGYNSWIIGSQTLPFCLA